MIDHGHSGAAMHGDLDVPMDLLALAEVAELLGEPESAILAACQSFPEHIPVVGSGHGRRFPSIALDVLRLITDATAAGVPAPAVTHLLETHYTDARILADEILTAPGVIPAGYDYDIEPVSLDLDEFVERVRSVVAADVLPQVQAVVSELGGTRAALEQMHAELVGTEFTSELTKIQTQLRPALLGLNEVKLAIEGLREEMAALRWQLDQREQLGRVVAELAELRTQVGRIEAGNGRESAAVGQPIDELPEQSANEATIVAETNLNDDGADTGPAGDDDVQAATASPPQAGTQSEVDAPSAIITEFASRTPRRMGRTLFADEG